MIHKIFFSSIFLACFMSSRYISWSVKLILSIAKYEVEMLINEKQQTFLQLRVIEGKALETISKEIDVPVHLLKEWSVTLIDHIEEMRINEIDRISADAQISLLQSYRNLADTYKRLKKELDSRDFTGLTTDKLYYIFNHVQEKLIQYMDVNDNGWDDAADDYDDLDEFD